MSTALFFLPSILCLLFGFQYFFRKKNRSQRYMMYLFFAGTFYFITYAFYISPKTDYLLQVELDSVNEPLLLCTISMFIAYIHLYIHREKDGKRKSKVTSKNLQWFITPAMVFGAINLLLYYLVGFETAGDMVKTCDDMNVKIASPEIIEKYGGLVAPTIIKLHGLFNQTIFTIMSLLYAMILVASCLYCTIKNGYRFGDIYRFFCKGQETTPERAACACTMILVVSMAPLLVMGRTYFINHMWASAVMTMFISISLFILANAEMMSQRKRFTIHAIVTSALAESGVAINGESEDDNEVEKKASQDVVAENAPEDILAVRTKHIIEKMHAAFENDKVYSNPELTVGSMAEMIGTNRTTLSNIINQQYGITFRDLVNRYRIDAAKAYIREHPTATQEEIAVVCGFRSASALNHKFKEVVGMPPTLWLTSSIGGEKGENT